MRSIFSSGFNLPPGCTVGDIDRAFGFGNETCDVCGKDVESCICPECAVCGGVGDPACYPDHGLTRTPEQIASRAEVDRFLAEERAREAEYLEQEAERYRLEREAAGDES